MSNAIKLNAAWDDIQPYYIGGDGADAALAAAYGTTGFQFLRFVDSHSKDESKQFGFQMPHRWKSETDVHFHIHVVPSQNGVAGNEDVVMQASYQWVNIGSVYSTTTNTDVPYTFRVGAAEANKHILWEFPALSAAGKTLSSDLVVILKRLSKTNPGGADNYTGDIWLRYVDVHVRIDSLGSIGETFK